MVEVSSSSTFRDSEQKLDINVQINNSRPILIPLLLDEKLTEIRVLLADEENIHMNSKMNFMSSFDAKIPQNYEMRFLLKQILHANNTLKIISERELDPEKIKESCKLEYGISFSKNGPKSAKKKALDITNFQLKKLEKPDTLDETVVCQTEIDEICVQNFIARSQVAASLPWSSISATLNGSRETKSHVNIENSITYRTSKRIKAEILYSELEVKPTNEFTKDVDDALASENPRAFLEEIAKEYGPYWCKKLGIGGRILFRESKENILKVHRDSKETKASGKLKASEYADIDGEAGKSQQSQQTNSFFNENAFFKIFGGSEESYHKSGMSGWINSLNDYQEWAVAEYTEINSIFDILDPEKKSKVAAALTKRIVESKVETLSFRMDISRPDPYIYKLPSNLQLSDENQIFVTEMKEDESKYLFATRIHYIDDKTPVIIIHRLGKLKKRSKSPKFTLKLGWIVIGTSTMLNLFGLPLVQPVFESNEIEVVANDNDKRFVATIQSNQQTDPNNSLLATCVSRANNSQEDPRDSKYIAGVHFVSKNSAIETCVFCYELQNMTPCIDTPIRLSVNWRNKSVAGTDGNQFGQTQINSKLISSLLSKQKRFKVCFDIYKELIDQNTKQPNEQEQSLALSTQRTLQSPVFVSLVMDDCPGQCIHGFFNITPDHAIFKSLKNSKNSLAKNGQKIAYSCFPTRNIVMEKNNDS
ncbi:12678_t:CDS:2 [Ambispora leptoticha]|uniref:12678_t:CDS:1 n=1 Tax=Ambispora leptoticha TaxID=144679 RepID=A0A9N9GD94_9GLOM|nr:12678_t:CDS:2 [Ambispora leptoticha]